MSKLCLGTVQLGMKYGVNNELGRQPTEEESFAVLRAAKKGGVEFLDTASAYGEAETLLGRFGVEQVPPHLQKARPYYREIPPNCCEKSIYVGRRGNALQLLPSGN